MPITLSRQNAFWRNESNAYLTEFAMKFDDHVELNNETLKFIVKSVNRYIEKAEKKQPHHFLSLLRRSTSFDGVLDFALDDSTEIVNSWSLQIISLVCIAISLPTISSDDSLELLMSVEEGIEYTYLVDETLDTWVNSVDILRVCKTMWRLVTVHRSCMGISLPSRTHRGRRPAEIIQEFMVKAQHIISRFYDEEDEWEVLEDKIVAESMFRVANTILVNWSTTDIDHADEDRLFSRLRGMISEIFAASLNNLPRLVMLKFTEDSHKDREGCVRSAATLVGNLKDTLHNIQGRQLPRIRFDKTTSILEWRSYPGNFLK